MSQTRLITVVELQEFLNAASKIWSDDERAAFINYIAANPTVGAIVEGTGGVRKIRWSREGAGKRGGVRVIYYFLDDEAPLFLLSMFAKSAKSDLDPEDKRNARLFVQSLKKRYRRTQ